MHIIKFFQTFFEKARKNRGVKVLLIMYWVSGNNIFRHCCVLRRYGFEELKVIVFSAVACG